MEVGKEGEGGREEREWWVFHIFISLSFPLRVFFMFPSFLHLQLNFANVFFMMEK